MNSKWLLACAALFAVVGQSTAHAAGRLPPPPFRFRWLEGWRVEHVAFAVGHTGKPVGGPARWAIGGCLPQAAYPADQAGQLYTGAKDSDTRLYFSDQRRRFWILEKGEVWPIAGADDLGELDGPGPYARFLYTGAYNGHHSGMVASGHSVYVMDHGWLRRIHKREHGTWLVTTVAGQGRRQLRPAEQGDLADLGALGKGLAIDAEGNLYFTLGGGVVRATPEGKVSWLITPDRVRADLAAVYARKWPGVRPRRFELGVGEGVELVVGPDGAIYGGGRSWPPAWKVSPDGRFVPLVGYAPRDRQMGDRRWGPGDPACYVPHCPMGFGVTPEGFVWFQNEIPFARTRYEASRVTVFRKDGTWGLGEDFFRPPQSAGYAPDGTLVTNAPGPFHSRSAWIRIRKED